MNKEDVYNNILSSFNEHKNSHAFLIETNNIDLCFKDIKNIVKIINCKQEGKSNCTCNICNTIEENTNPDVIIISPEGKEIKKDQILMLMDRFATKPLINKYSIYIIINAEKMNISASNKILKFLEEPEENIVGFFITDKLQSIIPTIKSRCEIYNYRFGKENLLDLLEISENDFSISYDISVEITKKLNNSKKYELMIDAKTIAKKERNEIDLILNLIRKFYEIKYEEILTHKYTNIEYAQNVINLIETNDLKVIVKRIKILDNIIKDFNLNVNKELFINKLFLIWE